MWDRVATELYIRAIGMIRMQCNAGCRVWGGEETYFFMIMYRSALPKV